MNNNRIIQIKKSFGKYLIYNNQWLFRIVGITNKKEYPVLLEALITDNISLIPCKLNKLSDKLYIKSHLSSPKYTRIKTDIFLNKNFTKHILILDKDDVNSYLAEKKINYLLV